MVDVESLSIIIPVYNDAEGLHASLESINRFDTNHNYQIHIVNNDSTDRTAKVAEEYASEHNHIHLYHETGTQSSYAARNTGIYHSEGDVLCFLDANVTVQKGCLQSAMEIILESSCQYLAPDVEIVPPKNPTLASRYNVMTGFPNKQFVEKHRYAPTACLFVTRELINHVGRFDERLISGGDLEFGNRVYEAGYDLHYTRDLSVNHPARTSFRELIGRNIRIGRGHCQLQRYYPHRYGRVGIPPRPDRIRLDTYDRSMNRALFTAITVMMTATRGIGYFLEVICALRLCGDR